MVISPDEVKRNALTWVGEGIFSLLSIFLLHLGFREYRNQVVFLFRCRNFWRAADLRRNPGWGFSFLWGIVGHGYLLLYSAHFEYSKHRAKIGEVMKQSYLCSFCYRSLPVGQFVDGHWCCFWCFRNVFLKTPPEDVVLPLIQKKKSQVTIEEIQSNNEL